MDDCIEVSGARGHFGYGVGNIRVGRKVYQVKAHRVAFEQAWGITLRSDQAVRHTCDNPPCINPLHLMVGTKGDNNRDMITRGRHYNANKTHCNAGHELPPERSTQGWRYCRICKNGSPRASRGVTENDERGM